MTTVATSSGTVKCLYFVVMFMATLWVETACGVETQFVPRVAYAEYTNTIEAANWLRNAINERREALGINNPLPIPASDSQADYLSALKSAVRSIVPNYVDQSKASGTSFDTYFGTPASGGVYPTTFPTWTVTSLLVYCGLPTNYFQYTPWRPFRGKGVGETNENTYGNFTTLDYGWEGLRTIVRNLKWTANGASEWWVVITYSYQSSQDCVHTDPGDPCQCDNQVDCSPTPNVDTTKHGGSDSLWVYAECVRSRVTDYTDGQFVICRAGGVSKGQSYMAQHRAISLSTNFPSSVVDFYQMNKLADYMNFSTWRRVSGLDWNGRTDRGNACPDNEEYWTNSVPSPFGHPFRYMTTASMSSSGTACSASAFSLIVQPIEYFSRSKAYYCTVGSNLWSFATSSTEARDEYTAITRHLNRWVFIHGDN
jgi:hypothetical protein